MAAATALLLALSLTASASDPTEVRRNPQHAVEPTPPEPSSGFSFLGFAQARMVLTNVTTTNPLLDGQIVGRLGGSNGTTTGEDLAWYSEQRINGFFTYRPPILDARMAVTAGFEIDFGFGDSSYGVSGNKGGGFGADQVNLQTRRLHFDATVHKSARHQLTLRLGQQFLADGPRDPVTARPDDLFRTGGSLRFFGSEATGLQGFGTFSDASGVRLRYRAGAFTLWEQGSGQVDDTTLFLLDAEYAPSAATRLGLHAWYLNDDSGGTGGFFGVGPTSQLAELQGAARLDLRSAGQDTQPPINADVAWIGVDGGFDHDLSSGPIGVNGSAFVNVGRFTAEDSGWAAVLGWLASGEVRFRYAPGRGSILRAEGLFVSGDDPDTIDYEGVLTGNSYGIVGAIYGSHGTVLLFPDITAINRQSSMVYDVSNAGRGMLSGQLGVAYDIVPNRVNLGATFAHASAMDLTPIGTELNLKLDIEPVLFFHVGLTGAVVLGTELPANPWATYAHLQWVVF